ncbi:MAG: MarR family winged helix-turn-helix transcriptional regulator [Verrucomicrobiota bacterium]
MPPTSSSQNPREIADRIASDCLVVRSRYLNRTLTAIYDEAYRPLGATANQMNLLVAIEKMGEVSPLQLGQALNIEKSTLSRNLTRMEREGWIAIEKSGRQQTLSTTRTGQKLLKLSYPLWKEAQEKSRDLLGKSGSDSLLETVNHLWSTA